MFEIFVKEDQHLQFEVLVVIAKHADATIAIKSYCHFTTANNIIGRKYTLTYTLPAAVYAIGYGHALIESENGSAQGIEALASRLQVADILASEVVIKSKWQQRIDEIQSRAYPADYYINITVKYFDADPVSNGTKYYNDVLLTEKDRIIAGIYKEFNTETKALREIRVSIPFKKGK